MTKFGRFSRAVDPGLVKINPLSEHLTKIDVKIQLCEVPQQVCMTKVCSSTYKLKGASRG